MGSLIVAAILNPQVAHVTCVTYILLEDNHTNQSIFFVFLLIFLGEQSKLHPCGISIKYDKNMLAIYAEIFINIQEK